MDASGRARAHTSINMCSFTLSAFTHTPPGGRFTGLAPRGDVSRPQRALEPFPGELTQFEQPALPVRVEERVREVVAVVLWDLERLVLDALVQVLG